jgi:hypothetical protein
MRLEERCKCGGEMVLVYDAGNSYSGRSTLEKSEAHKQIDNFRRRHKVCLNPVPVSKEQES